MDTMTEREVLKLVKSQMKAIADLSTKLDKYIEIQERIVAKLFGDDLDSGMYKQFQELYTIYSVMKADAVHDKWKGVYDCFVKIKDEIDGMIDLYRKVRTLGWLLGVFGITSLGSFIGLAIMVYEFVFKH